MNSRQILDVAKTHGFPPVFSQQGRKHAPAWNNINGNRIHPELGELLAVHRLYCLVQQAIEVRDAGTGSGR